MTKRKWKYFSWENIFKIWCQIFGVDWSVVLPVVWQWRGGRWYTGCSPVSTSWRDHSPAHPVLLGHHPPPPSASPPPHQPAYREHISSCLSTEKHHEVAFTWLLRHHKPPLSTWMSNTFGVKTVVVSSKTGNETLSAFAAARGNCYQHWLICVAYTLSDTGPGLQLTQLRRCCHI